MNALADKYGDKVEILGFPCNQVHYPALRQTQRESVCTPWPARVMSRTYIRRTPSHSRPCYSRAQFGHQTNEGDDEFLNTLKHVRPGKGFELNKAITVMAKGDVNGANEQPLFKWMKREIMIPTGGDEDSCLVDTNDNGCGDADALVLPRGGFGGTTLTLWSPVARSDIAWNFEKFLIDGEGNMVQRYHRYFLVGDIEKDIDSLM